MLGLITMEITAVKGQAWQLKTKLAQLVLEPGGTIRVEAESGPIIIAGPGEYEVKGFSIIGKKNNGYLIAADEITVGYLTAAEEVDVLLADSWEAVKTAQPSVVIPATPAAAAVLIKDSGLEPKREKKLLVNKAGLPEETELVILEQKD